MTLTLAVLTYDITDFDGARQVAPEEGAGVKGGKWLWRTDGKRDEWVVWEKSLRMNKLLQG